MTDVVIPTQIPDMKDIVPSIISSLYQQFGDKINLILTLAKILLVVFIIYFIVMIISKIYKIRDSRNLNKIALGVEDINLKLDSFVKRKSNKKYSKN